MQVQLSTKPRRRSTGFTLIEVLVVIGIIAVLGTLVGVVITKARGSATKFQLAAQLQAISVALDAYKTEFGSLPMSATNFPTGTPPAPPTPPTAPADIHINREGLRGARLLCKMLMGATGGQAGTFTYNATNPPAYDLNRGNQDGKAGLGFTTPDRTGVATLADNAGNMVGKTYGPYLAADKFKIANTATDDPDGAGPIVVGDVLSGADYDDRAVLLDANGNPILYFPLMNPQAPLNLPFAYLSVGRSDGVRDSGTAEAKGSTVTEPNDPLATPTNYGSRTPGYSGVDNSAWLPTHVLRYLLGDVDLSGRYETAAGEKPPVRNQYILWTAGPDGKFGPRNPDGTAAGVKLPLPNALTVPEKIAELKAAITGNRYDDVTNLPE